MNSNTSFENYILFGVSFIAAILFFITYPSQDPRSAARITFNEKEIAAKAVQKLSELGFSGTHFTVSNVAFKTQEDLLDSLQYQLGRQKLNTLLKAHHQPDIKPFFWEVEFLNDTNNHKQDLQPPQLPDQNKNLRLRFDENGKFMGLVNPAEFLPQQKVQREALGSVFVPDTDSVQEPVMKTVSDSLLNRMLYFDMQKKHLNYTQYRRKQESDVRNKFKQGIPYRHSVNDARALADYYLSQTGWQRSSFKADTVFVKRINTINAANVRYRFSGKKPGQKLRVDVVVAPTGALLQMKSSYNASVNANSTPGFAWSIIRTILIFGLALAGFIMFFFRIRARAIDTQSALVVALVTGFIFSASIFLMRAVEINFFSGGASLQDSILLFLQMGFGGAFAAISFFILFAISDSITRQHWPQKLSTYDYVRQGMILNKPIGVMLLRAIALSFILCGFWTLVLYLFPHSYFSVPSVFLNDQALWAPLLLLLRDSWFSFALILAVFLVVASLVYGQSKNRWLTALFVMILGGIIVPVVIDIGPSFDEFLMGALLAGILAFIYIKWDFLTILLAHFLFLGFMGSVTGWMVAYSPDKFIFIIFITFVIILGIIACIAIFTGKEERSLPEYVPSYVEEMAQEQRIKQELQIAREVQQSFLPSKTPAIAGLDVAAICQPAYETGGDYYDFIPIDDHRVAVTIGDVSGKGIQAAFYMTLVKGMLHSLCRETDSPAEVLSKANRLFCENAVKGTFISLIYGVLDMHNKTFTFARAGHNPILHSIISTGKIEELRPNGLGLGLTKGKIFDNKIEEIELSITEDDLFLLYTDGIVEALNPSHQFYGTDKLKALIKKQKHKTAAATVAAISKAVTRFIGKAKQHDDMTLMAIRFSKNE